MTPQPHAGATWRAHAPARNGYTDAPSPAATAGPTRPCGTQHYRSVGAQFLARTSWRTAHARSDVDEAFERYGGATKRPR